MPTEQLDRVEESVRERYAKGAQAAEPGLCCPGRDAEEDEYLKALPREIVEKDYGCGTPSRWARAGDTVLDLGSGAGKACYVLAQKVGPTGRVTGVDFNDAMLALARKHHPAVTRAIGYDNVRFVKGRIQDLALDLERAQRWLESHPIRTVEDLGPYESECARLRREEPMIGSDSVDLVVSNCVLNLVRPQDKERLFAEIFRVLKRGGRAVISDIVCDEEPTAQMQNDPELWSGCISGAFREDRFPAMFEQAGFHGVEILSRADKPWQIIEGIEFRSMTVRAYKGKQGPCFERHQAALYKGPWKAVTDDDGHTYERAVRTAVCDKTYKLLTDANGPYAGQVIGIEPENAVPLEQAQPFDCSTPAIRDVRVTKSGAPSTSRGGTTDAPCCGPGGGCC